MVQQRLVDSEMTPLSQGWRVFDEVTSMPRGNIATRWAITTSQVAGNDLDSADQSDGDQVKYPIKILSTTTAAAAAPAAPSPLKTSVSFAMDGGPGHQRGLAGGTKKWTEEEIRHLICLRAHRVPYQVIAAVSFHPRQKMLAVDRRTQATCKVGLACGRGWRMGMMRRSANDVTLQGSPSSGRQIVPAQV